MNIDLMPIRIFIGSIMIWESSKYIAYKFPLSKIVLWIKGDRK